MKTVLQKINTFEIFLTKHLDTILLSSLYLISFLIPLLIQHPQLLVGITVNTVIIYSTLKYGFKKSIPIFILPSLAAYSRGILFGGATMFLLFFIPFIIASNAGYSFISKTFKNTFVGIFLASIVKASFLFAIANIYVNSKGFPEIFLTTMGINQWVTGVIGGVMAGTLFTFLNKKQY